MKPVVISGGKKGQGPGPLDRDMGTARGARAAPPRLRADECPIEALYEEHLSQRQLCADMDLLAATDAPRPELARSLLASLCRDVPLHVADEEQSLFPRLRACARPEDDLEVTLTRLSREHEVEEQVFGLLAPMLACLAEGALPTAEARATLRRVATARRRHLIVENAILLPLARLRLTGADKRALMAEICARRARGADPDTACARALARLKPT
ncbi:MAG: hemerythrin domain-containing protein [Rhodobacteraceae bacterium]|nr:hemerythrin domain-containing protein [Paracoccaceae bacterium]